VDPTLSEEQFEALQRDAGQLLRRAEARAKSAGGVGCSAAIGMAVLMAALGQLGSGLGFVLIVLSFFVGVVLAGKRAVRQSLEDYQKTFRDMDRTRRQALFAYLSKRANPQGPSTPQSKAAASLLRALTPRTPAPSKASADATQEPWLPPPPALTPERRVEAPPPRPPPPEPPRPPHTERAPHAAPPRKVHVPAPPPARPPPQVRPPPPVVAVQVPSALAPPPPPPPPLAPVASTGGEVRCDSCGLVRTVPRGESAGLCPTCFPQIRLDG